MLSPKIKRNIMRIIPFGLLWLIFGISYLLIEKATKMRDTIMFPPPKSYGLPVDG